MEGFAINATTRIPTATTSPTTVTSLLSHRVFPHRRGVVTRNLTRHRKPGKLEVFASKEEPMLDQWDQMELKFGKLLGEDPKLTMAKIMGKKANPDASYLEIEKSFYGKKGEAIDVKEVPFEVEGLKDRQSSGSLDGLNLARPVPKKGVKFQGDDSQPMAARVRKPTQSNEKSIGSSVRSSVPNVILRKPTVVNEDDVDDKPSRLRIKRNLSLSMRNEPVKEKYSDMTLLRKPEPMSVLDSKKPELASDTNSLPNEDVKVDVEEEDGNEVFNDFSLIEKPEAASFGYEQSDNKEVSGLDLSENIGDPNLRSEQKNEYQPHNSGDLETDSSFEFSGASLQTKPKRPAEPVKGISNNDMVGTEEVTPENPPDGPGEEIVTAASEFEESEDGDWMRAEYLARTGRRGEVELLSSSTRGFVVSFGSLIGFLPYRNLATKWKFLAFESWLRHKGLDPSQYKQNLGVIGSYDATEKSDSETRRQDPQLLDRNINREISPDTKLEDLLIIYDQEKLRFLSSFVGQKIKVNVLVADRKFRKLVFSVKPKEKEELVEKKRSLMAKLRVGDVVKCCIKKITYFGIFVEVEGVPALIHQTEVSWDATLDPMAFFKIGQIVEAKVHQLDFALERIFLSLKEITPDPLIEALESVVGDHSSLDGRLEASQLESEWVEVESLIKELEQIEGVQNVTKGRFFLSPGLAPTFQVYMASIFENQYKLLARAGNKVREVIVEASLDKEEMKSVIMTCTNRVE